jgi:hypothetical protein
MTAATFAPGVPAHSWQATACAGGTIGVKGMMVAAKSMALTTVDLFTDPAHIQKAKAEFDQKRGPNFKYTTRLADRKARAGLSEMNARLSLALHRGGFDVPPTVVATTVHGARGSCSSDGARGFSRASSQRSRLVKALVFDVFGTVVDWRSSVALEVQQLAKRKGATVDGEKFADAWRPATDRA